MNAFFTKTPLRKAMVSAVVIALAFTIIYLALSPLLMYGAKRDLKKAVESVFTTATRYDRESRPYDNETEAVYTVYGESGILGYLYNMNENGLTTQLDFFVGIDMNGRVIGIYFPYLDEPVSYEDSSVLENFLQQFKGKETLLTGIASTATLPGEITVMNGAEVTSYAIIDGVNAALESYAAQHTEEVQE